MSITIFKPSDQTWPTWNSPEVLRKPHFLQPGLVERLRQGAWHGYTVSWVVGEYMIVCHLKWDATLHLENSLYVFFSHQNLNNVQNVCWWLVRGLILANIQRIFRFCRHFQIWRISWAFGWHGLLKEFPNTSRHRPQGQAIRNNWICVWCPIDASNSICVNKDSFHFRASMFFFANRWHLSKLQSLMLTYDSYDKMLGFYHWMCCFHMLLVWRIFIFHNIWDNPLHYTTLHSTTLQLQLHSTTLHYTPLHSTTLNYTTPHYTTLHYTTLHYTSHITTTTTTTTQLHSTTLHYAPLHSTTLNYTTLHYITLHYTPLHYIALHYLPLHSTTLNYTTLHYTTFHYTPLHYTTLH